MRRASRIDGNTVSYQLTPVPKPRQTRSDKWKQRPSVISYRNFADQVRDLSVDLPEGGSHIVFVIPMARSWSKKKRAEMDGQPHQQRPDLDNLIKALADAVHSEDSHLWDYRASKIWGEQGEIRITR